MISKRKRPDNQKTIEDIETRLLAEIEESPLSKNRLALMLSTYCKFNNKGSAYSFIRSIVKNGKLKDYLSSNLQYSKKVQYFKKVFALYHILGIQEKDSLIKKTFKIAPDGGNLHYPPLCCEKTKGVDLEVGFDNERLYLSPYQTRTLERLALGLAQENLRKE